MEERVLVAVRLRAMRELGLRPQDRHAVITSLRGRDACDHQVPQRVLRALGLYRKREIDCRDAPNEVLAHLRTFQPDVISAYPGVLGRLAQLATPDEQRLIRPRFVVSGGEVLTPHMAQQIADGWGAPVFNVYGAHEFKTIAWQCRTTEDLHIADDSVVVEILRDGQPVGPGETGELVGTALHSFAMPFLRYRLGDTVVRGAPGCACGRPFSTVQMVHGRVFDYFALPDGRLMHPIELSGLLTLDVVSWIRQFQIVQERQDRVVLRMSALRPPSPEEVGRAAALLSERLGPRVEVATELVPEIPLESSGKYRARRPLVRSESD
jgi:phenylacetate-CoA ligase